MLTNQKDAKDGDSNRFSSVNPLLSISPEG